MRLTVSSCSFRDRFEEKKLDLPALFLELSSIGIDRLEALGGHFANLSAAFLDELKSQSARTRVSLSGIRLGSDFGWPDPAERSRQVADISTWIDVATALEAPVLRLRVSGRHDGVEGAEVKRWLGEALKVLTPLARKRGRRMALYDETPAFQPGELAEFVRELDPASPGSPTPTLGLSLDVRAWSSGEADRVFHLSAPFEGGGEGPEELVRAWGRARSEALGAIVCLEYLGGDDPGRSLAEMASRMG